MDWPRYVKEELNPSKVLQRTLGFRETRDLMSWVVFGGSIIHFALTRIWSIDVDGVLCGQRGRSIPGECFFWRSRHALERASIILHLGTILPASTLAILQFVPLLRRRPRGFHRVNGYVVLLLSMVGTGSGLVVAQNSFGGTLELQSAMVLSSVMFLGCMGLALYRVLRLQIEKHRAWMLRSWAVAFHVITMRLFNKLLSSVSLGFVKGRFVVRSCAVVDYIFAGNATTVEALYPACTAFYTGVEPDQHVLIWGDAASTRVDHVVANFGITCASSAWLALALHCVLVEVYLASTPAEAERLERLSCQRQMEARLARRAGSGMATAAAAAAMVGETAWTPLVEKEIIVASDSDSSNR